MPDLKIIMKRFNLNNDLAKVQLLRKLNELKNPASTFLLELEVKGKTDGRPSLKVDTSTHRNPSKFEYGLSNKNGKFVHVMFSSTLSLQQKNEKEKELSITTIETYLFY